MFPVCIFRGTLKPDASYTNSIDVELNVGTIQKVTFLWKRSGISVSKPKMGASRITVQSGKDGTKCVSFIPSKFHDICISVSMYTSYIQEPIHIYISIYLSVHLAVHPFLCLVLYTMYPFRHLFHHPYRHPVSRYSLPFTNLLRCSSQLPTYSSDLLWTVNIFLMQHSTCRGQSIGCKA